MDKEFMDYPKLKCKMDEKLDYTHAQTYNNA